MFLAVHLFSQYGYFDSVWFWQEDSQSESELFREAISKLRYLQNHPEDEIFDEPIKPDLEAYIFSFWITRSTDNVVLMKAISNDTPAAIREAMLNPVAQNYVKIIYDGEEILRGIAQ